MPQMPNSRKQIGFWRNGSSGNTAIPGNGTVQTCMVVIPFKHRLLEAKYTRNKVIETGTVTVRLQHATTGTGRASGTDLGTIIGEAANSNVVVADFALTDAEKSTERAADSVYWLEIIGTNSADRVEHPVLDILVQPQPRMAL